jgi:predicted SAM-dependent methyltransferase
MKMLSKWLGAGIGPEIFRLTGMRPWSFGYAPYKRRRITEIINLKEFDAENLPIGYGFRLDERIVEYPWFLSRLPSRPGTLLDAGSILNHEYLLKHPLLACKRIFISTLAPEAECFWRYGVSYVYEDLRDSCFRDGSFDWIVSLSTVEHIGMDNTMLYTADAGKRESDKLAHLQATTEFHRLLKAGGTLYLSVPFGKHQDHGWFQIFDAPMVDRLIETFRPTQVTETHFRYTASGWVSSDREASRNSTYFDIHKRKTYDADFAAASRAVVCLELVK